ncbi:WD40 repeat domain-containing protein [Streptomyces phaeochromogenes]|uniref:WD40 repeat domain-containing protein n=1 Tax=Streptomyces phaeochromogenes TaxID=1923 RepID=UPI00386D853D
MAERGHGPAPRPVPATKSGALLDCEPDLASLLAVHAYRTSPTREATAVLYAAAALPLRKRPSGGTEPVDSIALSPDGHAIAANSRDGKVGIWSLPGGRLRHTFAGYDSGEAAAFSPDGCTLAVATVGGADGMTGLLDPVAGKRLRTITVPDGFSPTGARWPRFTKARPAAGRYGFGMSGPVIMKPRWRSTPTWHSGESSCHSRVPS